MAIPKKVRDLVLERTCSADDCDRKVFARRMCRKHWQTWRDTHAEPCSVDGCKTAARANGMCNLHWQRNYHHGSPEWEPKTVEERFWEKVDKSGDCWEWQGALDSAGYGVFNLGERLDRAHRITYQWAGQSIPDGYHVDHLCRNRRCCRPAHLEAVPPSTNWERGESPTAISARTGRCSRGHSMADAYVRSDTGTRMCRTCIRERSRRRGDTK